MDVELIVKRRFAEIEVGMKPKEAIEESNRCLYCYDAPCITACPTGIEIPSFIKKIATGNLTGSARVIMDANPVGASCARVCPTEQLCEGACVLNEASQPIAIGMLQRYATDAAMKKGDRLFSPGVPNGWRVAIIGGGPAGLSAARELARFGYQVTIYEAKEKAGGLDTYGIVSFRLPQEVSLWEVDQVQRMGVTIKTNVNVGVDISFDELLAQYDVMVLTIGMGKVPDLHIEGEQLSGVYDAIELIEETKRGRYNPELNGAKVAVIGAGNTAIDAATCCKRLGAEQVKIVYRRTQAEMTAYDFEYSFAKEEGVEFRWLTLPRRIIGDAQGNVTHVECVRVELSDNSEMSGRPIATPIEGSEYLMEVDAVVKAIGQNKYVDLIDSLGIKHHKGVIEVNPLTFQTSNSKIYAAGDCIFGSGGGEATVVSAAQQGKLTAHAIHRSFQQNGVETA